VTNRIRRGSLGRPGVASNPPFQGWHYLIWSGLHLPPLRTDCRQHLRLSRVTGVPARTRKGRLRLCRRRASYSARFSESKWLNLKNLHARIRWELIMPARSLASWQGRMTAKWWTLWGTELLTARRVAIGGWMMRGASAVPD